MNKTNNNSILKLKGKTAVFIDWANVHGWESKLKQEIDLKKLFKHLKAYKKMRQTLRTTLPLRIMSE